MEPKDNARKGKSAEKPAGIDPIRVFREVMQADEFDAHKVQVMDMTFGERVLGRTGKTQIVSIIDAGGEAIDVYPVVARFKPRSGRAIRCYVIIRQREVEEKGKKVVIRRAFAIPVSLRAASRTGEWASVGCNILDNVVFRVNRHEPDKGQYAFGPNGKIIVVAAGLEMPTGPVRVLVVERLNCFVAHCMIPPETDVADTTQTGLIRLAETVGATLEAVDNYGFYYAGRLYDACEILALSPMATKAEIAARRRELAMTEHPDMKAAEFKQLTGSPAAAAVLQDFNFEYALIEEAAERMLLVRKREDARKRSLAAGRKSQGDMPEQVTVGELVERLGQTTNMVKAAFSRIGYPGVKVKDPVAREIAWIVAGLFVSGALATADDLSADESEATAPAPADAAPADSAPEAPPAPAPRKNGKKGGLDLAALKVALGLGGHYNGQLAAEVVAELKAAGTIPANWPEEPAQAAPASEPPVAE